MAGRPGPGRRHRMVDTACWTRTGDRRHGWRPGRVDHGDNVRLLDAGWRLRWADASGRATDQDRSAARTTRGIGSYGRGLTTATTGSCSGASPAKPRLGTLLSSDDFGSSVERAAHGQVLWRVRVKVAGEGGTCGRLWVGKGQDSCCLAILGRRLLDVCVKSSEDEVASGVRSTSADTLSDQPRSEWPAGREADRTLAQRTAAVGLTDRGSLSEFALMADRPLQRADDDGLDLGGLRRSLTGATFLKCGAHAARIVAGQSTVARL
jgi:hypothetical protein